MKGAGDHAEAGYLFGLMAECAVKHVCQRVPSLRADDVFYAHFPELKTEILGRAEGRSTKGLVRMLENPRGYLGGWHVGMRYADDHAVSTDQVKNWHEDAIAALNLMEAL